MNKKVILKIRDLNKSFNGNKILKNINLDINEGESVVIIGGSGSGKSVLLKCILGLIEPDSNSRIEVFGIDLINGLKNEKEQARRKISMLFQGSALFDSLSVWENVFFSRIQNKTITRQQAKLASIDILSKVGLGDEVISLYPAELSGGMQRRVALARAIVSNPKIIFFDEPTTGLDPIMARIIDSLILQTIKDIGATALTITHDMNSACRIANRLAMLYDGTITWQGSKKDLYNTDNKYVKQFVRGTHEGK